MNETNYPTNEKSLIDLEPAFFNNEDFSWCSFLQSEWINIKQELDAFVIAQGNSSFYQGYTTLVDGSWTTLMLTFWRLKKPQSVFFPKTMEVFAQIPMCHSISFSKLAAGSVIKPHFGENNAYYRCHLGLDIPDKLPDVGFKVADEERSWGNGDILVFNDAKMHSAYNFSDKDRTIIIFDVWRDKYLGCFKEATLHQLSIYSLFFELKLAMNCNPFNQNDVYWYNVKEKLSAKNFIRYQELYAFYADLFGERYFDDKAADFFFDLWDKSGGV